MRTLRIQVFGIVQGVGFRPFIHRLAERMNIRGTVANKGSLVEIDLQAGGSDEDCHRREQDFLRALRSEAPARSFIMKVLTSVVEQAPCTEFTIIESAQETGDIFVSPDIATCDLCTGELLDPRNRRYLHPFINCTACGPRLTILESMPYDRERTSMKDFPMCPACHSEYTTPETRRFDAQPVCCNDCGPVLRLHGTDLTGLDALHEVRRRICDGGIVAIKGIGGFHLACSAASDAAVAELRRRKNRRTKPFAVMFRDLEHIRQVCDVDPLAETYLTGWQKPILLLRKRTGPGRDSGTAGLSPLLAPDNPRLGVFLPYTPVHILLFALPDGLAFPDALVMTSANHGGAPICRETADALRELDGICDALLTHDRHIRVRADDSVVLLRDPEVLPEEPETLTETSAEIPVDAPDIRTDRDGSGRNRSERSGSEREDSETTGSVQESGNNGPERDGSGKTSALKGDGAQYATHPLSRKRTENPRRLQVLRRSRGMAPLPSLLPLRFPGAVLGMGSELKNTFCLAQNGLFYLSPHVGDLEDLRTVQALQETLGRMEDLLRIHPDAIACDLHPSYTSTQTAARLAEERGIPLLSVQHHHAHILSCMAENEHMDPVIGIACDGTGFGTDRTVWGGEILIADPSGFTRFAHIAPFPQTGGDAASRDAWRMALCLLHTLYGEAAARDLAAEFRIQNDDICRMHLALTGRNINTVLSTSTGRLFDGLSALLTGVQRSDFEGEAAMRLQFAGEAARRSGGAALPAEDRILFTRLLEEHLSSRNGSYVIPTDRLLRVLIDRRTLKADPHRLALLFHAGLALFLALTCRCAAEKTGIRHVAISGGVFQNTLLEELLLQELTGLGLTPLLHSTVPANDGGLSLGQAFHAAFLRKED